MKRPLVALAAVWFGVGFCAAAVFGDISPPWTAGLFLGGFVAFVAGMLWLCIVLAHG